MKYSIDESMTEILSRGRKLKENNKIRRQMILLAVSAATILVLLIVTLYQYTGSGSGTAGTSAYGALMVSDEAGGYVLVGVLSFIVAVIVTLICIKIADRNKSTKKEPNDDG